MSWGESLDFILRGYGHLWEALGRGVARLISVFKKAVCASVSLGGFFFFFGLL